MRIGVRDLMRVGNKRLLKMVPDCWSAGSWRGIAQIVNIRQNFTNELKSSKMPLV